jgi:deoxyribodipyrimidine photo-lyase
MTFTTNYNEIIGQIEKIDPVAYGKTRNFIDGAVTRLSPYISRGVISTKMLMERMLKRGYPFYKIEKLVQELAWRDYWQQVWVAKGSLIDEDLKHTQPDVINRQMACSVIEATTGIDAVDEAIRSFYTDGYLHNHVRMYIAAIACNIGKSHWKTPARWMYYHLLDGDWASNALSWQWVAGANANKKYYANQDNINKYCHTAQSDTFLSVAYDDFENMAIPEELKKTILPELKTVLPEKKTITVDPGKPALIYNYYNLDPNWKAGQDINRILLLEPSVFKKYPISENPLNFMLALAENIPGIQVYTGEFDDLKKETGIDEFIFKEHPLNYNYKGKEEPRDWMFGVKGYYPSFFAFWKRCQKELP